MVEVEGDDFFLMPYLLPLLAFLTPRILGLVPQKLCWRLCLRFATFRKTPTDLNPSERRQAAQLWQEPQTHPAGHL